MVSLAEGNCIACRKGEPMLTDVEIQELLTQVSQWQVKEVQGVKHLEKAFKFRNFAEALAFTNKVGAIAEEQDHHPLIITEWGKVTIQWWTHVVGGLHRNDFVMAAKTDELFSKFAG